MLDENFGHIAPFHVWANLPFDADPVLAIVCSLLNCQLAQVVGRRS